MMKKDKRTGEQRVDVYTRITDKMISALDEGVRPWMQPWSSKYLKGRVSRPLRHNGEPYSGINVLLLWSEAMARGYASSTWMTFRQAQELGACVRKGETSAMVVYANRISKTETDGEGHEIERDIPFLKAYSVFNVEQIDGLGDRYADGSGGIDKPIDRIAHADAFFAKTGAVVRHGGDKAFYAPGPDLIQMPPIGVRTRAVRNRTLRANGMRTYAASLSLAGSLSDRKPSGI
jgi:antirestriction protein ArdC